MNDLKRFQPVAPPKKTKKSSHKKRVSEVKQVTKHKINPHRTQLIALSKEAKQQIEVLEAISGERLTVNQMLIKIYTEKTGATVFKTFNDWKKEGHIVQTGETAFRIWGSPIQAKKKEGQEKTHPNNKDDEANNFEYFPMCCLFGNHQVKQMVQEVQG